MKVLTQNFKNGQLRVGEYPFPGVPEKGALVATTASAVSFGTEKSVVSLAKSNPLQKIRKRPDLAKKVWEKAKNEGLFSTLAVVKNLVDSPIPLGYSSCGIILKTGVLCDSFSVGDRVACAGYGYANHGEVNAVPATMMAKIPSEVSDDEAAFTTIACVALHALRISEVQAGEIIAIFGLGLIGQLAAKLAILQGATVVGFDIAEQQVKLAQQYEPTGHYCSENSQFNTIVDRLTLGRGVDHSLVCTAGGGEALLTTVGTCTRDRGRVVLVGDMQVSLPRRLYFEKELDVRFSRAYGPGRYDSQYEIEGIDYPYPYVRWTMQRNMQTILQYLQSNRLSIAPLITHRIKIADCDAVLESLFSDKNNSALGILIQVPEPAVDQPIALTPAKRSKETAASLRLGVIGAGLFGQGVLLPAFNDHPLVHLQSITSEKGLSAVAAGKKNGIVQAVSSADDIIHDPDINAVIILTNHGSHARYICQALRSDKHVFCEKPLALHSQELQQIADCESESRAILMLGYNRRFAPFTALSKDLLSSHDGPLSIIYRVNAGPQPVDHWVHSSTEGGGRIIGEVCHYVDYASYIIGHQPLSVCAMATKGDNKKKTYYDTTALTITYADGSIATIHFIANGNTSVPKEYIEIHKGGLTLVNKNFRHLSAKGVKKSLQRRSWNQNKGYREEISAFVQGCKNGISPTPAAELYTTSLVTFAAMQSMNEGAVISLEQDGFGCLISTVCEV